MKRRAVLGTAASAALASLAAATAGCRPARDTAAPPAVWLGAAHGRGHRLRGAAPLPAVAVQRRAQVLIVGAGVAGLAAARTLMQRGVDDLRVLELEDTAGGNSRGHRLAGIACPLGAHYLPLPGPDAHEVSRLLHELGLLRSELGRTVADDRHLCHSPQERLYIDGAWSDGLLPLAEPGSVSALQRRRFAAAVAALQGPRGGARRFTLPAHRAAPQAEVSALNTLSFAAWLDTQGLDDVPLRWYLDYCCRDDYGAGTASVSAWAGIQYFASRHGFHAPGETDTSSGGTADREAVFTWPEGNAWLTQRLAAPLADRLLPGRTVLQVDVQRHGVQVLAFDETAQQAESWQAQQVILAVPLFIAARLVAQAPQALRDAASLLRYAPWLVTNLQLDAPLLDRPGAPPSWDNVIYGSRGLGYVDAMHQSLRTQPGPTVLTAYHALPLAERGALLAGDAAGWRDRVLQDLAAAHPDIHQRVQQVALMRWGHAMAIPLPGVHGHPALAALRAQRGRLRFAHADLAGCSVFEEAYTAGCEAAQDPVI